MTTTATAHRTRVDLDLGTAPGGAPVRWQFLDGRGQTRNGLIIDHDHERRHLTQTLIAQRARAATGAHIARLDGTWGREPGIMWRDVAADAAAQRPLLVLIEAFEAWHSALGLWLLLSRLGPQHRISLVLSLPHLSNLTTLAEPKLTAALTGRYGQWLMVGRAADESLYEFRQLPGADAETLIDLDEGQALYRNSGTPQPLALHEPDLDAPDEEFRCPECEQWGEWTLGASRDIGDSRDEYDCLHCYRTTALSECERRII